VRALPGYIGAYFPEPDEELLLRAALDDPARAAKAWEELAPRFDLHDVTWSQYRILPLVARNLAGTGVVLPDPARWRGIRTRTWSENQLALTTAGTVLATLATAGIDTMVLKGVALLAGGYYDDAGLRPMRDIDLMVPAFDRAVAVLAAQGWTREPQDVPSLHADRFVHTSGRDVDLHWEMSPDLLYRRHPERSWDDMWAAAVLGTVGGSPTRLPDAADLLLHVCAHGAQYRARVTFQWVADAAMVVRAGSVDWARLVDQAARRRATLAASETLRYLSERMGVAVPAATLAELSRYPATSRDRLVYRARAGVERTTGGVPTTRALFWVFVRRSAHQTVPRAIAGVPSYLQHAARLDSPWAVPGWIARRAMGRPADS
jgi:hypothetical protein